MNYEKCRLCPRRCGVDRTRGGRGFCGASDKPRVARAALHFWEEPCISGEAGAGAVFFSHCTLRCVYCQNRSISALGAGREITEEELAEIFLSLQERGANNIDLVTPTHYAPSIIRALDAAKGRGLNIPVIYNSSGYEAPETIRALEGYVDIYMPDIKYFSAERAKKYSCAPDYFSTAAEALRLMYEQVGKYRLDENGLMRRGVIARHLMLPGLMLDTKRIMDFLRETYGANILISLMSQYTPLEQVAAYPELNRVLDRRKYEVMVNYCADRGMENVYIQEEGADKESFIPPFEE